MRMSAIALVLAFTGATAAHADEGMWTFDAFPAAKMKASYGWAPDKTWLDHVQGSAVRLTSGCSASVVSKNGLVLTNWHCSVECAQTNSTAQSDYVKNGFLAATKEDERKCPGTQAEILSSISDVTDRVKAAIAKAPADGAAKARNAESANIESEGCKDKPKFRCEVVQLYHGGQFKLYTYRKYSDVRLAFIPEQAIGFFGGDPDNFNFPRYNLDVSLVRLYEDGKPVSTPVHLGWRKDAPKAGEPLLVAGNPGGSSRLDTMAQMAFDRDWAIPTRETLRAELLGRLYTFAEQSEENRRETAELIFGVENSYKGFYGRWQALLDPDFMAAKAKQEADLRAAVAKDAALSKDVGDPWGDISGAISSYEGIFLAHDMLEARAGSVSDLFQWARTLVRAGDERAKPNADRMPQFTDSRLALTQKYALQDKPVYPGVEKIALEYWLSKTRQLLTVDDPRVRRLLGKESPEGLAKRLVDGTKLADPAVRKALWDGGQAAIANSTDPLIVFARQIDTDARALRKEYESKVEGTMVRAAERIARARFAVYGASDYPDATFTLRLSYGKVDGWTYHGQTVKPFTKLGGIFDRATGSYPFELPKSWYDAKSKLNLNTPFDMSTTHDIIGGNSGSPMIDAQGRVVGAIFDGNIHSLGGEYGYDGTLNRAVTVTTPAIAEALRKIYSAGRLVDEMESGN